MAEASTPARIEAGWVPAVMRTRPPALYRIPVTLSLMGLFLIAIQAGQPLVGFASMMAVLATATALSLRTMSRRYAPAAILRDQGDAKLVNGRYAEARAFYERALAIVQRELPPASPEVLLNYYSLAAVSSMLHEHDRADEYLEKLLTGLGGRVPSSWQGQVAWLLRRVGQHQSVTGRHRQARRSCERALELVGDAPGADDNTVRSLVDDLAWVHHRAGEYDSAEQSFREAVAIHERYRDVAIELANPDRGRERPERSPYRAPSPGSAPTSGGLDRAVAHSLVGLGWTLLEVGRYADADAQFARALMLSSSAPQTAGGDDGALRAEALRGRAAVLAAQGRYDAAAGIYRQARTALARRDTPQAIALSIDGAWLACLRGDSAQAEVGLAQAAAGLEAHPQLLSLRSTLHLVRAELRRRQERYKDAHREAQRAIGLVADGAREHPRRAAILAVASRIHTARSEFTAAERCARRALQVLRTMVSGSEHPKLSDGYVALGELHAARGQWGAAEHDFRTALALREGTLGESHPELADPLQGLAGICEATARDDEARTYRARLGGLTERADLSNAS